MLGADFDFARGIDGVVEDGALGGVHGAFHFAGQAHAARENPFVAFVGEPALGAEAFVARGGALLSGSAAGDPAFVAIDDAGDGGLIQVELLGDPGLFVAVEFDPVVDETVAVGGGPGAVAVRRGSGLGGFGTRGFRDRHGTFLLRKNVAGRESGGMATKNTKRHEGRKRRILYKRTVYVKRFVERFSEQHFDPK